MKHDDVFRSYLEDEDFNEEGFYIRTGDAEKHVSLRDIQTHYRLLFNTSATIIGILVLIIKNDLIILLISCWSVKTCTLFLEIFDPSGNIFMFDKCIGPGWEMMRTLMHLSIKIGRKVNVYRWTIC